jgi:ssDNA-binding Zn-finger/Zn-ribbon topoisomerase 1
LTDEQRIEDIACPTCGQLVKLDLSILVGASGSPLCPNCGYFHASRDADGEVVTRSWGGSLHADKKTLSKPCLDCESILHISIGKVMSVSPMNAMAAESFCKEDWKQLLMCPNCRVRGITLGANKNDMLFAQCPKCRYYLKFPKPLDPA